MGGAEFQFVFGLVTSIMPPLKNIDSNVNKENLYTHSESSNGLNKARLIDNKSSNSSNATRKPYQVWDIEAVLNDKTDSDILGTLYSKFSYILKLSLTKPDIHPNFTAIVNAVTENFSQDPRYINDHRLLHIWLSIPSLSSNYDKIYSEMMDRRICIFWSKLYMTFSEFFIKDGKFDRAKYICQTGLNNKAEPRNLLEDQIRKLEGSLPSPRSPITNNDTPSESSNIKRSSSPNISETSSKKPYIIQDTSKIHGNNQTNIHSSLNHDDVGVCHLESTYLYNPSHMKKFSTNKHNDSRGRQVIEKMMSINLDKNKDHNESYEEHRAKKYFPDFMPTQTYPALFESPISTPQANRINQANINSNTSERSQQFSTPQGQLARQNSSLRNDRVRALMSNSNTPRAPISRSRISSSNQNSPYINFSQDPDIAETSGGLSESFINNFNRPRFSPPNNLMSEALITRQPSRDSIPEYDRAIIFPDVVSEATPEVTATLEGDGPSFTANDIGLNFSMISDINHNSQFLNLNNASFIHTTPELIRSRNFRNQERIPYPDPELNEPEPQVPYVQETTLPLSSINDQILTSQDDESERSINMTIDRLNVYRDP